MFFFSQYETFNHVDILNRFTEWLRNATVEIILVMTFVHSKSTRIVRVQHDSEEIARDTILGPGEHRRVHSNL